MNKSIFSLLAVFCLIWVSCDKKSDGVKDAAAAPAGAENAATDLAPSCPKLAFFNEDSLMANFTSFSAKKEALSKKQEALEKSANSKGLALQKEYMNLEAKAQGGDLPPQKIQEEGMKLEERRERLMAEQEKQGQDFQAELASLNEELRTQTLAAIEELKQTEKYDIIFLHGAVSAIMDANPAFDITDKIVTILNKNNPAEK